MAKKKTVEVLEETTIVEETVAPVAEVVSEEVKSEVSPLVGKVLAGKKITKVSEVEINGKSFVEVVDEDKSTILLTPSEASQLV